MPTNPELALSYAALVLADEGVEVTPDKLQTLLEAAGVDDVETIWNNIFAKALKDKDMKELLTAFQASAPASGSQTAAAQGAGGKGEDGAQNADGGGDADADGSGDESGSDIGMSLFD